MSWKLKSKTSKIVALFICAVILTASITTYVTRAVTTAPSTLTISSGIYPGAPSYTVWTESSVYYCKDANGLTVQSSSNASEVLNYATYKTFLAGGGTVYIKFGIYYLTNTVLTWTNLELLGEEGAVLTVANGQPDTWGVYHGLVYYRASVQGVGYNITVDNLVLKTNPLGITYTLSPIIYSGTNLSTITNCVIDGFNGTNIAGIAVDGSYNNVLNNQILNGGLGGSADCEGIYVEANSNHIRIHGNKIINMSREGIYTQIDTSYIEVSNNIISDIGTEGMDFRSNMSSVIGNIINNATNGIYITNTDVTVSGNTISNITNGIVLDATWRPVYNIAVAGNSVSNFGNIGIDAFQSFGGVTISNNAIGHYWSNGAQGIRIDSSSNCTVIGNALGYNYDGIRLSNSTWNIITGNLITAVTSTSAIIETSSTADSNVFVSNIVTDYIMIAGANSKCHLCYNGTTWVA